MAKSKKTEVLLIDSNKFISKVKSINFKSIDFENIKDAKDVKVRVRGRDNYKIIEINRDEVCLELKREQFFEPSIFFELEVIMYITYNINNIHRDKFDKDKVEKEINDNIEELLQPIATFESLIISNITNISNEIPIITPPFFRNDISE